MGWPAIGVLPSPLPNSGLQVLLCLAFVCGCWGVELRSSHLGSEPFTIWPTSPAPAFILCSWCKHSKLFLSAFWSTQTSPDIGGYFFDRGWRKERHMNVDLLFVFISKFQKQLDDVKGWKNPVILWAADSIPNMETPRRLFRFCWSEIWKERWSLCRGI